MVQVIMGLKGTGKTKRLVDMVRSAVETAPGSVVCIEKDKKLTYDIPYQVRLIHASDYAIGSVDFMKGFLSGLHAGNYDITHVFIDNFAKMLPDVSEAEFAALFGWLDAFSAKEGITFTVSITMDPQTACDDIKKFAI